ncbi:SMR family transporter [Wolbachia endosymbiont (group A) of Myopa testacea]|uniref:SMR family transporter n=1 Tax=Wolbachia endosymbiont (group A) of Myopa testacea TaxID=3066148 RepID=UPI003341173D
MCWLYLLLSSILEILWAVTLKFSNSFTKVVPSIATLVIMIISIYFLSLAACFLPIKYAMQFPLEYAQLE